MAGTKLRFLLAVVIVFTLTFGLVGQIFAASSNGDNGLGRCIVVFDTGVNDAAKDTLLG